MIRTLFDNAVGYTGMLADPYVSFSSARRKRICSWNRALQAFQQLI